MVADGFTGPQDVGMRHWPPKGGSQGSHRSDLFGPLGGHRARDDAAQAVPDEMYFPAGGRESAFYCIVQPLADQQVRTFRVPADSRKVRPVADGSEPGEQLAKIGIGA